MLLHLFIFIFCCYIYISSEKKSNTTSQSHTMAIMVITAVIDCIIAIIQNMSSKCKNSSNETQSQIK